MLDPHLPTFMEWPEVEGIARLPVPRDPTRTRILIATRWDAWQSITERVRSRLVADEAPHRAIATHGIRQAIAAARTVSALDIDGSRLDIEIARVGDVLPCEAGESAEPLHDPKGVLAQWVRWSHGRPRPEPDPVDHAARLLELDDSARSLDELPPGARRVESAGHRSYRHGAAHLVRNRARDLEHPGAAAFVGRLAAATADVPPPAEGIREDTGGTEGWERFLGLADREGFAGDRMLFQAVTERLTGLEGSAPTFAVGFCLPTFDQVEGRWDFARKIEIAGHGFRAGIWFGVGVTPADALEFWAAPTLTSIDRGVEWIADDGERPALLRSAGRDAFLELLTQVVEQAHARAADFESAAQAAFTADAPDVDAVTRSLSLARSVAAAVRRFLPTTGHDATPTHGHVALALSRAGIEADPLVARLYARAAGRLAARGA